MLFHYILDSIVSARKLDMIIIASLCVMCLLFSLTVLKNCSICFHLGMVSFVLVLLCLLNLRVQVFNQIRKTIGLSASCSPSSVSRTSISLYIKTFDTVMCSWGSDFFQSLFSVLSVLIRTLHRDRTNKIPIYLSSVYLKRYYKESAIMEADKQLWRLTSPKICRVSQQAGDQESQWGSFNPNSKAWKLGGSIV